MMEKKHSCVQYKANSSSTASGPPSPTGEGKVEFIILKYTSLRLKRRKNGDLREGFDKFELCRKRKGYQNILGAEQHLREEHR